MSGRKTDRCRKSGKIAIEYAIQFKQNNEYIDYSIYNSRTCLWKKPIEDWAQDILTGYEYRRCCEKHKSTRLVKRTTITETIANGGKEAIYDER